MIEATFRLEDDFVDKYAKIKPPFGFNGLGELVYYRTYSRVRPDGTNERWHETIRRVVEGTYRMQERHIIHNDLGWNHNRAQKSAQEMYDRIFHMKFLPPGRGLWAMGSLLTEEREINASLSNCAFVTTDNIDKHNNADKPFTFLMDASMLGVGVGFDVKGAGKITIKEPGLCWYRNVISDDREGWVDALRKTLRSYFYGEDTPIHDYSLIRPVGQLIKGFGGLASGPGPLKELLVAINKLLKSDIGKPLSITNITDIQNLIGKCVVAGNLRRSSEIVLGDYNSAEYLSLKNYTINPQRESFGWTSNNSVFADIGMDYTVPAAHTARNGEPGYVWLQNMRQYSRMNDIIDNKDAKVAGTNPCGEQSLYSEELCVLVETFPNNHTNIQDFLRTLKFAYLYAKTVTLAKTHWPETNKIMLKNRRIGCSLSGIQQFVAARGIEEFRNWCETGYATIEKYDEIYSDWLTIPRSIKKTSVKPSGSVSLVAGATPGMHWPESRFYIRRMRLSRHSDLIPGLEEAGYKLEPAFGSEDSTLVVEIPVDVGENIRTVGEVSMWEQLAMSAFLQKYWADNQVSCTCSVNPDTESDQIAHALNYYQYQLKGVSFLPRLKQGAYPQMPYEEITEERYVEMVAGLKPLNFHGIEQETAEVERFCDGDTCVLR